MSSTVPSGQIQTPNRVPTQTQRVTPFAQRGATTLPRHAKRSCS
ncbi:hypothetical protein RB5604 [Rhodopirellula baltica SH 1]|uniref:Uncharacterized protein n=1 Tax=Rhodopirellula baltica (strain DSM 10527 / NCIMB 13988 / SH1) TaxID=243090 RepID=Q7URK9_RHOBA|nr:hypothetical protein RB5604 [Rhodopirellula baltica SH 1]